MAKGDLLMWLQLITILEIKLKRQNYHVCMYQSWTKTNQYNQWKIVISDPIQIYNNFIEALYASNITSQYSQ